MKKILKACFLVLSILPIFFLFTSQVLASPSFITIVNPIRGEEFWVNPKQKPIDAVNSQLQIITSEKLTATWLLRFDALEDKNITELLKKYSEHEKGLFFEITPSLAKAVGVIYKQHTKWYLAGNLFLTGYPVEDRKKIIDFLFNDFKNVFGYYPKSVGSWWIDAGSLNYMQQKYKIVASMIVADQYSTDSYQIWGQYWSAPFYPFNRSTLIPAQTEAEKIPVVITQWASRDPFNGYGRAVEESTYSVQPNDYITYHKLDINYFNKLVDIYTKQYNPISQLTIGLENSFDWNTYKKEYEKQIKLIALRSTKGDFKITTMSDFAIQYINLFPKISPTMVFPADDPLNSDYKVVWFMNQYYRAGLFVDKKGVRFRDVREYTATEEPCFKSACDKINFAKAFVSSVDDAVFGKSWFLDYGGAKNFQMEQDNGKVTVTYINDLDKNRRIEFLLRDISVDGTPSSISVIILKTTQQTNKEPETSNTTSAVKFDFFQNLINFFKQILSTFSHT